MVLRFSFQFSLVNGCLFWLLLHNGLFVVIRHVTHIITGLWVYINRIARSWCLLLLGLIRVLHPFAFELDCLRTARSQRVYNFDFTSIWLNLEHRWERPVIFDWCSNLIKLLITLGRGCSTLTEERLRCISRIFNVRSLPLLTDDWPCTLVSLIRSIYGLNRWNVDLRPALVVAGFLLSGMIFHLHFLILLSFVWTLAHGRIFNSWQWLGLLRSQFAGRI